MTIRNWVLHRQKKKYKTKTIHTFAIYVKMCVCVCMCAVHMYMCRVIKNYCVLLVAKAESATGTKDHRPIQMCLFSGAEIGMEKSKFASSRNRTSEMNSQLPATAVAARFHRYHYTVLLPPKHFLVVIDLLASSASYFSTSLPTTAFLCMNPVKHSTFVLLHLFFR